MAKTGVIRVNPERTLVEVDTPDGDSWGPEPYPASDEDGLIILSDEDKPGDASYVAVCDGYGNLKPNTIYQLVEVGTILEEDAALTEGDEDEDDDDDDDEEPTKPS